MPNNENEPPKGAHHGDHRREGEAIEFAHQAEHLAQYKPSQEDNETGSTQAVEAKFITPLDPVIETANGGRLPTIPVQEADRLNKLKDKAEGRRERSPPRSAIRPGKDGSAHGARLHPHDHQMDEKGAPLGETVPPSRTNPLFPPLPVYGPPSTMRSMHSLLFRITSAIGSLAFLLVIVAGAVFRAVPRVFSHMGRRAVLQNPKKRRPFYEEEMKRREERRAAQAEWSLQEKQRGAHTPSGEKGDKTTPQDGAFVPTAGGADPLSVDIPHYARRVGLDAESFDVQTEDGFIIQLWHIFNPRDYHRPPTPSHKQDGPDIFQTDPKEPGFAETQHQYAPGNKKYPVLLMHGLLQSAGAYCSNDDDSLAFYLAKSGYDVWLGNNRCGFNPRHTMLSYEDPRMWAWNIRQMGVMDLPAFVSRVLAETGFPKLALIAHSQGTTQTLVALAKEQRPDLGTKISVFCALAPAAYAGPLIGKIYFKIMHVISPALFRLVFGIHAFIPLMMAAHDLLPGPAYSWMGYHVFSYLFSWSDARWERSLRARMFQWAPTYVSAESMRWWLGRECFARHKCILATRDEGALEDAEDDEDDEVIRRAYIDKEPHINPRAKLQRNLTSFHCPSPHHSHHDASRGKFAWYDARFPPLALWVCGADDLVDGRRLLRRLDRGREPHVRVVHQKIVEGYEHLDVIWAMDAIEKVGKEVREVIWRTVDAESAAACRVPVGCGKPLLEEVAVGDEVPMVNSGGRGRMASISEGVPTVGGDDRVTGPGETITEVEASREKEGEHDHLEEEKKEFGVERLEDVREEPVFEDVKEKGNPLG